MVEVGDGRDAPFKGREAGLAGKADRFAQGLWVSPVWGSKELGRSFSGLMWRKTGPLCWRVRFWWEIWVSKG